MDDIYLFIYFLYYELNYSTLHLAFFQLLFLLYIVLIFSGLILLDVHILIYQYNLFVTCDFFLGIYRHIFYGVLFDIKYENLL